MTKTNRKVWKRITKHAEIYEHIWNVYRDTNMGCDFYTRSQDIMNAEDSYTERELKILI